MAAATQGIARKEKISSDKGRPENSKVKQIGRGICNNLKNNAKS